MLFNSAVFVVLFFFVYSIYWTLSVRGKHYLIIVASLIFYAWYSVPFLLLFLFLLVFNYSMSTQILRTKSKALLWTTIAVDVGNLVLFKYFYLFAQTIGSVIGNEYLGALHRNLLRDYSLEIIQPIGISFYTFQVIAYIVDCYSGVIKEQVRPRQFFVFVLFFPHFVAGPIMRALDLIPQVNKPTATPDRILNGMILILFGVVKKVLIADRIALIIGDLWFHPEKYDATFILIAMPAFGAQIYCDFSGYTDIARGLAKMMGFEIPENFRGPMVSASVQELWQRWHITLSSWLRDYVYFPLGGSKGSELRSAFNLIITMGLAGLWHGATWTMLFWGIYMGVALSVERFFRIRNLRLLPEAPWATALRRIKTFAVFTASGVLFCSPDLERTGMMIDSIVNFKRGLPSVAPETLIGLTLFTMFLNYLQYHDKVKGFLMDHTRVRYAIAGIGTFAVGLMINLYGDVTGTFIYFQF